MEIQNNNQNAQENLDNLRKEILEDLKSDGNLEETLANLVLSIISIESVIQGSAAVLQAVVDTLVSKGITTEEAIRDSSALALKEIQAKMDNLSNVPKKN